MAVEVKCLFAIDAIAAVYRTGALFRLRRFTDAVDRSIRCLSGRLAGVRRLKGAL
jgi:hypothetical protein